MPTRVCIRKRIVEPVAQHAVVEDPVAHAVTPPATLYQIRSCIHVLHAASDGRIHRTHQNFLRCGDDRLRTGATDPIQGHAGDLDRQPRVDRGLPCGIHLVTGLHGISDNHCSDLVRPQARSLKSGADGCRSKLNGRNILQRAAECSNGCANRFGNHDRVLRCHGKASEQGKQGEQLSAVQGTTSADRSSQ